MKCILNLVRVSLSETKDSSNSLRRQKFIRDLFIRDLTLYGSISVLAVRPLLCPHTHQSRRLNPYAPIDINESQQKFVKEAVALCFEEICRCRTAAGDWKDKLFIIQVATYINSCR